MGKENLIYRCRRDGGVSLTGKAPAWKAGSSRESGVVVRVHSPPPTVFVATIRHGSCVCPCIIKIRVDKTGASGILHLLHKKEP